MSRADEHFAHFRRLADLRDSYARGAAEHLNRGNQEKAIEYAAEYAVCVAEMAGMVTR